MEACRYTDGFAHLVYASSSSVYSDKPMGGHGFTEDEPAMSPVSLYAATKRACELMSQSCQPLRISADGPALLHRLRPLGPSRHGLLRLHPKIVAGEPIDVYGEGRMARDFTYIDDIVDGIVGALDHPPPPGGHHVLNIGDSHPVGLMEMIETLERALGRQAVKVMLPMQPGDVTATYADISRLQALTGYRPKVMLAEGIGRFVDWYRGFYPAR